jgi:hypothetical protein
VEIGNRVQYDIVLPVQTRHLGTLLRPYGQKWEIVYKSLEHETGVIPSAFMPAKLNLSIVIIIPYFKKLFESYFLRCSAKLRKKCDRCDFDEIIFARCVILSEYWNSGIKKAVCCRIADRRLACLFCI